MDRWILLTGASSGIGLATAKHLDSQGYHIALVSRRKERLETVAGELKNTSLCIPFDLKNVDNIESIFQQIAVESKLCGMVHCAGIGENQPIRLNDLELMKAMMETNFYSFVELGKYFGLRKYSENGASIVAISSISPITCYPGACSYASSKAAINTAVRVMAKEFLRRAIRVNAILPAYVNAPLGPASDDENYIAQQPLGIIEPEYIAYMAEFLLSEKSKYMTGTLIPISGGMNF